MQSVHVYVIAHRSGPNAVLLTMGLHTRERGGLHGMGSRGARRACCPVFPILLGGAGSIIGPSQDWRWF